MISIARVQGFAGDIVASAVAIPKRYRTIIRYALVGGVGYVIYVGLLFFLYDLSAVPFFPEKRHAVRLLLLTHGDSLLLITTLIGTQASIVGVFTGHTLWTFAEEATRSKPLWLRFMQFEARALVSTLGVLTVTVNALVLVLGGLHYLAVPAGLVLSFAWNWAWDSKFIWVKRKQGEQVDDR